MRKTVSAFIFCAALAAFAQPPGGRAPAIVSPEVATDGKVTFRLRAPNAKEVYVTGILPGNGPEGGRLELQKNDQGVWSATTEPMQPGIYQYAFNVDGLRISDPGNNRFGRQCANHLIDDLLIIKMDQGNGFVAAG